MITRPLPPPELLEPTPAPLFTPAPDVLAWISTAILEEEGALHNDEHAHLGAAHVGVLWANHSARSKGRAIVGTAEIPLFRGAPWVKARQEAQMCEWFGEIPDFVITLSAPYAADADDASWCALVEHELYHCAQALDMFGAPRFNRETGRPIFTMRGHDVEEFVGVVARYGAEAAGVQALVRAASHEPLVGRASIASACGACLLRAA